MIDAQHLHRLWRTLPVGSLTEVIGDGTALILAPHPDDESLGCGGLIASCCAAGRPPLVAVLTDGSGSHPHSKCYPPERLASVREVEARHAVSILGLCRDRLRFLRQIDTRAPHDGPRFDVMVDVLANMVQTSGCSALLAPTPLDPHGDHVAAARIAGAAAAVVGVRLLSYPVWAWTLSDRQSVEASSVRGWRLAVTPHLPAKRRAIAAHASQYGGLISDDPTGFQLPQALLRACDTPWESFLLP